MGAWEFWNLGAWDLWELWELQHFGNLVTQSIIRESWNEGLRIQAWILTRKLNVHVIKSYSLAELWNWSRKTSAFISTDGFRKLWVLSQSNWETPTASNPLLIPITLLLDLTHLVTPAYHDVLLGESPERGHRSHHHLECVHSNALEADQNSRKHTRTKRSQPKILGSFLAHSKLVKFPWSLPRPLGANQSE